MVIAFQDTFEDLNGVLIASHIPTPNGGNIWVNEIGDLGIFTDQFFEGSSSLRTTTNAEGVISQYFPAANGVVVTTFALRVSSFSPFHLHFYWYDGLQNPIEIMWGNTTSTLFYVNGSTFSAIGTGMAINTWYEFRITANISTGRYSIEIRTGGGSWSTLVTNALFRGITPPLITKFDRFSIHGQYYPTFWFDNLLIDYTPPSTPGQPMMLRQQYIPGMKTYQGGI